MNGLCRSTADEALAQERQARMVTILAASPALAPTQDPYLPVHGGVDGAPGGGAPQPARTRRLDGNERTAEAPGATDARP